ncbi:MAG: hypothetical protein FWH05_06410 [Oscillospiraceae bacterium]|nr:hypothetical protein [Oscillospiraceae bacterium]
MKTIKRLIGIISLAASLLLCSCLAYDYRQDASDTSEASSTSIIEPVITTAIEETDENDEVSHNIIQAPVEIEEVESLYIKELPDIILRGAGGIPTSLMFIWVPFPIISETPNKLEEEINSDDYDKWLEVNGFKPHFSSRNNQNLIITRLAENNNFYSFLLEFKDNFSDKDIIEAFNNNSNLSVVESDSEIIDAYKTQSNYEHIESLPFYSDSQIEAIISMNEERILNAFISDYSIAKGVHYYTPEWLYYHTADDYKNAALTAEEILRSLNKSRDIIWLHDTFLDIVEYNLFHYSQMMDSDLNVMDICGYERDMSMPLPLGETTHETIYSQRIFNFTVLYKAYYELSDYEDFREDFCLILKNDTSYSMGWVYHNKPEAYREAGITPEELLEMLPKYRALGILRDEAMLALENKIFAYAAVVESGE